MTQIIILNVNVESSQYFKNSYFPQVTKMWNSLDKELKSIMNISFFKLKLLFLKQNLNIMNLPHQCISYIYIHVYNLLFLTTLYTCTSYYTCIYVLPMHSYCFLVVIFNRALPCFRPPAGSEICSIPISTGY